jgi:putative flippase GtrA
VGLRAVLLKTYGQYGQQVRYLLVGAWNTVFGYGAYALLYWLLHKDMSYVLILIPSTVIAITQNYFGYKFIVFRTQGNYVREYLKTYLVYGSAFLINLGALPLLVEVAGLPPLAAQALIMAVTVVLSYFFYKHYAFRPRRDDMPDDRGDTP